jgi:pimeloyl-ACP methyl ester carboxylesterase
MTLTNPVAPDRRAAAAVFVHGIFSGPSVWDPMIRALEQDEAIRLGYRLKCFKYESPRIMLSPLKRIPTIPEAANKLETWLREDPEICAAERLVLIGHSQGGLVIQHYITRLLDAGRGDELRDLRAVVLLGTPNTGSELLLSVRRGVEAVWVHPQERSLRPYDEAVEHVRTTILERAICAVTPDSRHCPIRFFVYAGESDNVVRARSAQWMFPGAGILTGDHFTIIQPPDLADSRAQAVRSALNWARNSFPPDGLLLETVGLDVRKPLEIEAVMKLQAERFLPREAVRSDDLRHWLENYQESWELRLSVLVGKANELSLAFLMFHESAEFIVVDYIASAEKHPLSQILVSRLIAQLAERSRKLGGLPIVFEAEDPRAPLGDKRTAQARLRLFQPFGARVIDGVKYLEPDMTNLTAGNEAPSLLMYARPDAATPVALSRNEVSTIVGKLYRTWYRNWFSHHPNREARDRYLDDLAKKVIETIPAVCQLRPSTQLGTSAS